MSSTDKHHHQRALTLLHALTATLFVIAAFGLASAQTPTPAPTPACNRTVKADVVAFDQVITYNRLGATNPAGMIYALKSDVVPVNPSQGLVPGNVRLRDGKRPRPITLRMNALDCLMINFTNLLNPDLEAVNSFAANNGVAARTAGVHAIGMQLVGSIASDGSNVGANASSLVAPGNSASYTFYAEREGGHLLYSTAATTGGEGDGGSLSDGLFGAINVEPKGAEWYRSQVTAADMKLAVKKKTVTNADGTTATVDDLNPNGTPKINYDAVYPAGNPRAGKPILKMLDASNNIVHTDLNAIITGPNKGRFPAGTYPKVAIEPDREQPFREFTVVYHDEVKALQAFPKFYDDPVLGYTLHSVEDKFAINYGIGGIGSEIIANRLGVGPMANCTECKFEEFFLSAWTVGDPAMIVDKPANTTDANGELILGAKATKVLFPDDPSNVHHSYINDHTKMRVMHAGPKEHHIHHLHAHQWITTPDDDNSTYLDSQAFGPGYSFTTEIAHGGSGNRNKTVGDSIFHCHFYPHFAEGMWELWRSHDVFEAGTELNENGTVASGARALPDGEIASGVPIPALVPVPTIAVAPVPSAANPGYPFYIPGVAGHRPPHPPMDTEFDGGLPRHVITGGIAESVENRLDFSKVLISVTAQAIPENGTPAEQAAMAFHAQPFVSSFTPEGAPAKYALNGLPAKPGAPFADPCRADAANADGSVSPAGTLRTYKAAVIQLDAKFNKAGWHFPQQRIEALWQDVAPTLAGTRPPEPFFFRANTNDCIEFHHTNLVPHEYALDDYQIKTPTDILGQHIHLVKFDVTSSDGSGNGFNYEDGTFAPGEVQERVHAIRKQNNCTDGDARDGSITCPVLKAHPFFGLAGRDEDNNGVDDWLGANTSIQRWYADDTLNMNGKDRTLRTVFTHDHFGPSTHQQDGLYAGLVVEPKGSTWQHNETGQQLGTRDDGGPTTWQAIINDGAFTTREFMVEFADYNSAYQPGRGVDGAGRPIPDPAGVINPPVRDEEFGPNLVKAQVCPGGVPLPCPEAISTKDSGTRVTNYRNEPIALRVQDPNTNSQAAGDAGDLSMAYLSTVTRANPALNTQPNFYPALTAGLQPGDPFTPLMRAYENDRVQIRMLVGAHEEGHTFSINGNKWFYEPGTPKDPNAVNNSGYRNTQMSGISEHFEFLLPSASAVKGAIPFADYLYRPSASVDGQWDGVWGLFRVYNGGAGIRPDLAPLSTNPDGKAKSAVNKGDFAGICPRVAPSRKFSVSAVLARDAVPGGQIVYNSRGGNGGPLVDPTAILYVRDSDLDGTTGKLKPGVPVEPLVLRANAGECINLTLTNLLPAGTALPDLNGWNTLPMIVDHFNANQVKPSANVGLHPQLVAYAVTDSDGMNVGSNPIQTAAPGGGIVKYQWYAGDISTKTVNGVTTRVATPIEFGATNLVSSDTIKHSNKGAIASLIIEPQGATWIEDATSRSSATVTANGSSFREFVMQFQNDINMRFGDYTGDMAAVPNVANEEEAEDSGQKAINYRTEPMWKRMGYAPESPLSGNAEPGEEQSSLTPTRAFDYTNSLSNSQVGGDPQTPIFTAKAGTPVRFRMLMSGGHARNNVLNIHGHIWQQEPYVNNSTAIGSNPLSEWKGSQFGGGPMNHYDMVLQNGAGGAFRVTGDYLYRTQSSFQFDNGVWGIFRVTQ
ncbi:MAG TPA: hypothetical protein VM864_03475 [Pyrinomonadaceae bacterium]|jgi:hypothetical protein|nr:hypothetical protein [Pyrinomonadaceae bacterium]